jgi:hypothetical protein
MDLTKPYEDTLVALAGVAKLVAQYRDNHYVASYFLEDIPEACYGSEYLPRLKELQGHGKHQPGVGYLWAGQ